MKNFLAFTFLLFTFTFILPGCETFDSSTKQDESSSAQSALSEEILKVKQDVNTLKGQFDELQYKVDKISQTQAQQSAELNNALKDLRKETQADTEKQITSLDTKLQSLEKKQAQDKSELQNKTNIVVEEVSKENKELRKQIESLKKAPAAPKQAVATTTAAQEGYYTVSAGDTLKKISQTFGIPVKAIMDANNVTDPNSIHVGQKLLIPEKK